VSSGLVLQWLQDGEARQACWHSESGLRPPQRVQLVDDTLSADAAYRLACEGTGLLWQGDFQNARHLLQALSRRIERRASPKGARAGKGADATTTTTSKAHYFHLHRQSLAQRARVLGAVLIPLEADYRIALRRGPDWRVACTEAWGPPDVTGPVGLHVATLRELLGLVGAHEWRKKGVPIAALGGERVHAHYGVFSPVRGEYVDLVAQAPLGPTALAFDIGTGTGVLAAVLARRGVERVVATDQDPRALACATENLARLGLQDRVQVLQANLFPPGRAALVVCNPPWVPAKASSPIEHAVYDEGSAMVRGYLSGLAGHLSPKGEGWLIMSDLAEHLGLRDPSDLPGWIAAAGLRVVARHDIRPHHAKVSDLTDPLHVARAAEVTSLWRLAAVV
jgi:methylase of polypeptide subunit release factors